MSVLTSVTEEGRKECPRVVSPGGDSGGPRPPPPPLRRPPPATARAAPRENMGLPYEEGDDGNSPAPCPSAPSPRGGAPPAMVVARCRRRQIWGDRGRIWRRWCQICPRAAIMRRRSFSRPTPPTLGPVADGGGRRLWSWSAASPPSHRRHPQLVPSPNSVAPGRPTATTASSPPSVACTSPPLRPSSSPQCG
jgi:hypothetical protein